MANVPIPSTISRELIVQVAKPERRNTEGIILLDVEVSDEIPIRREDEGCEVLKKDS
jgi:hypothetical protein